jgi:hypothetical protein
MQAVTSKPNRHSGFVPVSALLACCRATLEALTAKFSAAAFVPGNHELWVSWLWWFCWMVHSSLAVRLAVWDHAAATGG